MKKRCAIYARVSTEGQGEKFGLDVQLSEMRATAILRNYHLSPELEFVDDGFSGTDLERPALDRLREAVSSGQVDVVLAHDSDRLARTLLHHLSLKESLEKAHVILDFVTTEFQDSPDGELFFNVKGAFADYERVKLLDRTRRGRLEKARQGYIVGCPAPYGYRYVKKGPGEKGGRYIVDEQEAQIVRQIFTWLLSGMSARSIVVRLNAEGIPASRGTHWAKSSVLKLLKNEAYIGTVYFNRRQCVLPANPKPGHRERHNKKTARRLRPSSEWIRISVPAILDRGTFDQAQDRLKKNISQLSGRNTHYFYLLKCLLGCEFCQDQYVGCHSNGRRYYRCLGRDRLHAKACNSGLIHAEKLESFIWTIVCRFLTDFGLLRKKIQDFHQTSHDQKEILKRQLHDLELAKKRMEAATSKLLDEYLDHELPISRELFTRKHDEISAKLRTIEKGISETRHRLAAADSTHVDQVLDTLKKATANLGLLNDEAKQKFLRVVLDKVTLTGREIRILGILPSPAANRPQHAHIVPGIQQPYQFTLSSSLDIDPETSNLSVFINDPVGEISKSRGAQ